MKANKLTHFPFVTSQATLLSKDIWRAEELGIKPSAAQSTYALNFTRINPTWFRAIVKRFVRFQSATKSFNSCRSYITGLSHFGNFIINENSNLEPSDLNRAIILDYLNYLNLTSLQATAKHIALIHLRTFIEIVAQENWLPFPKERLLFSTDLPKPTSPMPRFIPETIMQQLNQHLAELPDQYRRFIFVLQETGRRISEVCTLPFECLRQDDAKDYFLEVHEHKLKKSYLIPITETCVKLIKEQQTYIKQEGKAQAGYLFVSRSRGHSATPHATARHINNLLNILAEKANILDSNGKVWRFHAHQFRHTVGTRMINAGVPQPIVQRYLGHESPEMTSRYAYIHDHTLKKAFMKFQGTLVNIHGEIIENLNTQSLDEQWLKHNIMAQALPSGYCGLPAVQQRCPHANACLTCTHFRTDERFLSAHEKQLKETNHILDTAEKNGWQRQVEMNQEVKINLEKIIISLKEKRHGSA